MSARTLLGAALVTVAAVASAEVRVVESGDQLGLSIQQASRGVWTPVGAPSASTLNPGGDLIGDGYPGHAAKGDMLVAAWQRPSSSSLVVLQATSLASHAAVEVPTEAGVGVPSVVVLDDVFLVAWQAHPTNPEVLVVVGDGRELGQPTPIAPGELVGVFKVEPAVHVVTVQRAANTLTIATFPMLHEPNPMPIPTLTHVQLMGSTSRPGAAVETDANASSWLTCGEERAHDTLLAWRAGESLVGRVLLEADGVDADGVFVQGPNGSCPAVLNAARHH